MNADASLAPYRDSVRAEWVDYNGHLRDAYYLLVFSFAADALIAHIGLDDAARRARRRSIYTLEAHLNYLHEVRAGTPLRVETRVVGHDAKRLHVYFEMFADGAVELVAACEQMLLHVDTDGPKAAPFDPDVAARVRALGDADARRPPAAWLARVIGLRAQAPR